MYLRGLSDITDGTDSVDPFPITYTPVDAPNVDIAPPPIANDVNGNYYSIPTSSPTASSSSNSWSDIFSSALKTYGAISVADTQAKTQQQALQYQTRAYNPYGLRLPGQTYPAGYSPFPAARPATSPISPAVILAAIGLGAAALYFA